MAFFLAYLLNPIVNYLHVQGLRRIWAILLVYLFFALILFGISMVFVPRVLRELARIKDSIPLLTEQLKGFLNTLQITLEKFYPPLPDQSLTDIIMKESQIYFSSLVSKAPVFLFNLFSYAAWFVFVPLFTFAILFDIPRLTDRLFNILHPRYVETVLCLISELNYVVGNFIRGQVIRFIWITIISIFGLLYIQIDYALLGGIFVGITNIVPFIGPWFSGVVIIILAFLKYPFIMVMKIVIVLIVVQIFDNFLVSPYAVGRSVKLSFLVFIVSIIAGAELWGFVGMIIAVPIVGSIKVVLQILYDRYRRNIQLSVSQ